LVPDTYDFNQSQPDKRQISSSRRVDQCGHGGSPVEAWRSEDALKTFDEAYNEMQRFKDPDLITEIEKKDKKRQNNWYAQLAEQGRGLVKGSEWFLPDYDHSHWRSMQVPGFWEDQGLPKVDGVVWFRKTIDVPETMLAKEAKLWLGRSVQGRHGLRSWLSVSPEHFDRNFRVPRENRVRVSDITYIETEQGRMYLTVIIDLFNRKVVGRSMGDDLGTEKTIVPALDGDWGQQKKNTFNIRL
jgi:hypothetical protein